MHGFDPVDLTIIGIDDRQNGISGVPSWLKKVDLKGAVRVSDVFLEERAKRWLLRTQSY